MLFLISITFAETNSTDGWRFLPERSASVRSNSQQFDLWIGVAHPSVPPAPVMPIRVAFETSVSDKMCMQKSKEKYENTDWAIVNGMMTPVSVICVGVHRIMIIADYSNMLKVISVVLSSRNIEMWTSDFQANVFENHYSVSDIEDTPFNNTVGIDLEKWMLFGSDMMSPGNAKFFIILLQYPVNIYNICALRCHHFSLSNCYEKIRFGLGMWNNTFFLYDLCK